MSALNKKTSRSVEEVNKPSRDESIRHSLPVKPSSKPIGVLKHSNSTSARYDSKRKNIKTQLPPSIPEGEPVEAQNDNVSIVIENDRRRSKLSQQSYDNAAFQPDDPNANSARSSKNPSINTVQREQYCCFSKWSYCERVLVATIGVLIFIIIILIIVVAVVASGKNEDPKTFFTKLFN